MSDSSTPPAETDPFERLLGVIPQGHRDLIENLLRDAGDLTVAQILAKIAAVNLKKTRYELRMALARIALLETQGDKIWECTGVDSNGTEIWMRKKGI